MSIEEAKNALYALLDDRTYYGVVDTEAAFERLILEVQSDVGCRSVNFSCCQMYPLDEEENWLCVPCKATKKLVEAREPKAAEAKEER